MSNPLGMMRQSLGDMDAGLFTLPAQQATVRRREYFERGQRVLAAYTSIAAYSERGREVIESYKMSGAFTPVTPIRLGINGFHLQTTLRRIEQMFSGAGAELTRQFMVAVYGNFEAFLADHVAAAFTSLREPEPEQATLQLMMSARWSGKLDRISQRFELGLRARQLRRLYEHIEMGFFGRQFADPVEFLQAVANLRHRIVHSSGRVDQALLNEYPECRLQPGDLLTLPVALPLELWFFFVPLTEELDRLFAERFEWSRQEVRPEQLT